MVLKLDCLCRVPCWLYYLIATCRRSVLMAIGTIGLGLAPAFALDSANTPSPKKTQNKQFTSGQQALRVGLDDLKTGNMEDSIAALAYAAANGQILARWKLGEMYATGDSVPRDDLKAYHYFNKLVEEYDEDQPDWHDVGAISDAFVDVGVYCLNGIPDSNVRPDPRRAHELFQYAATTFRNPNAQFNLARMYILGAGGLPKDWLTAVRWLALAAKRGHSPSEALLGHMLFIGIGVSGQRARGLMWLELAEGGASGPKDQWVRDLYQRDLQAASDKDRRTAAAMHEALTNIAPTPFSAESSVTSFFEPSAALPTGSLLPPQ
jgi:exopolysaccharide production negative regulator